MIDRKYWQKKIEESWLEKSIIWLAGVRRIGKTCLCKTLKNIKYFDCELPRIRRIMEEDPESFLKSCADSRIVLDEVHRLKNPSELLKIASDHYPNIKIIATGSSSLTASEKFKDTLTGRKENLWLTPMIMEDSETFGNITPEYRFSRGGLPPFFMAKKFPEKDFQDWMDDYWSKDIQELFKLERRFSFLKFVELLMMQSGGIFEATRFAKPCEISRTTVANYLAVLENTFVANIIRPFSSYRPTEIISAPKVYCFDTGFTAYYRGWQSLRPEDMGVLWEHFVLNEFHARLQTKKINYWRDKTGHEIDFVIVTRGEKLFGIECKWRSSNADFSSLQAFHKVYPQSELFIVAHDVEASYVKQVGDMKISFVSLNVLIDHLIAYSPL